MKAYKVEILIIDHDNVGATGVRDTLCNANYLNDCIVPRVMSIMVTNIGTWSDDHPLNQQETSAAEYRRLFSSRPDIFRKTLVAGKTRFMLKGTLAQPRREIVTYLEILPAGMAWTFVIERGCGERTVCKLDDVDEVLED